MLGLVVVVVAFLGLTGATLSWTLGVLGAAILILGLWGAGTMSGSESEELQHKHA